MSATTPRTRAESRNRSIERESHFQTRAEINKRQPKQEYAQTSINTPIRTYRISVDSSGQRIRSADASAVTCKCFGADSNASTSETSATVEWAAYHEGVARAAGGFFGGPARRGRRRQTEEDAEAHGEEPLTAAQDPEKKSFSRQEPEHSLLAGTITAAPKDVYSRGRDGHPIDQEKAVLDEGQRQNLYEDRLNRTRGLGQGLPRCHGERDHLIKVGELDFNSLLKNRQRGAKAPGFNITFVRYYWKEILKCMRTIHAHSVVHNDLKPANFILVKGRLKLIDFSIANAFQTDTTISIHRETMAGTVNYMSPESLMGSSQYAFSSILNGHFHMGEPPRKLWHDRRLISRWTASCARVREY
ncbi:hypothetical protein F4680DRAFT_471506 [Xylaria scruposa]|nr:hypothetical protein F4680DRAFT_471506 [Xylaria scruposa]